MITHDYKIIHIHIPKCGGRSVSDVFNQRFGHFTAYHYHKEWNHFWNLYDVISVVRNPFARLVSIYHFLQQNRLVKVEPIRMDGAPFKEWAIHNLKNYQGGFDRNSPEGEWGLDWTIGSNFWFSPQYRWNGSYFHRWKVKIFKMENNFEDLAEFFKQKGVKDFQIKHLNGSKHEDYRSYYDDELIRIVAGSDFCSVDCQMYGYNFDQ